MKNEVTQLQESFSTIALVLEQGRILSYPSRVRVGRGSDRKDHLSIWAEAVSSADGRTDGQSGVYSRVARDQKLTSCNTPMLRWLRENDF